MSRSLSEIAHNDPRLLEPLELFAVGKANCLQAVLMPFLKEAPPQTYATLMDMSAGLGGGVAGMGYVCGALLGGAMVLSRELMAENVSMDESERLIREFASQFSKEHGSQFCSGIKALAAKEEEYETCQVLVINTIEAVDKALAHRSKV